MNNMDEFLSQRYIPSARQGLAEQIIAAVNAGQEKLPLMSEVLLWLMIPKPQYMLAILLIIGVILGVSTDMMSVITGDGIQVNGEEDVLFYLDEGWL